ncbi:MAG: ABC transporter permease [Acidimicrobiia bacterium]|nr:ABC transporter permease [Acidimicrobiia bacterium]
MTAVAHLDVTARRARARPDVWAALRSEWTKFRSVRSTWWVLLVILAGIIGVGYLISAGTAARWADMTARERANLDAPFRSLTGLFVGQLAVGVLGVLVITSEYATGMIRSTLAAVPGRRLVLAAKGVVLDAPVWVLGTLASAVAFFIGQAVLAGKGGVSITDPGSVRVVMGCGLYLTALALLALALGTIFRHTAGGIAAFIGLVLVLPSIVGPLPRPWGRDISEYLPSSAGQALLSHHQTAGTLAPWTGFAVLCAWTAAALVLATWLIAHRDA